MKLLEFPLLADENIHPNVIAFLRGEGRDIASISEQGQYGLLDIDVLRLANESKRVVLTHDCDFGGLAVLNAQPVIGIVYLRPGHILAEFTIQTLLAIDARVPEINPPFILVAERAGEDVKIRIRQL
jgi:predicted nuclease of predicted toxin-antitoxin system